IFVTSETCITSSKAATRGTTTGKNVMPRVAALLDVMQVSEVTKIVSADTFERPIYAGNAIQTVQSGDAKKVITVRGASFQATGDGSASAPIESVSAAPNPGTSSFKGEARGRAVGSWASAGAIASAVGPPLGGWLVGAASWRAIFLINVPVALAAIIIAWRYIEESAEGEQPLDLPGAVLATLALGMLTWALTLWSSHHEVSPRIWAGLVGSAAFLGMFVLVEHRRREDAMMPLAMFTSRPFVGLTLLTFLLYGALGGLLVLLPYLLIVGGDYSPLQAGLALLPFSLVIGTASRLMGRTTERIGPRWPLTVGPIVTGLGFLLLIRVEPTGSYWTSVMPGIIVIALGMAGAVAPLTTAVLSSVDQAHTGTASGFNSAIARTGGLIATALAGAVIAQTGAALVETFRSAAILGGALAIASGCVAFITLGALQPARDDQLK
ncbi:MAG: MFS transporter, partial [Hyphomicrobiales bacterium]